MAVLTTQTTAGAAALLTDAPSPVVVIPIYNSYDDVVRCLEAVATHTSHSISVLVVDDGGVDRRAVRLLESVSPHIAQRVVVLEHEANQGYVRSCNNALAVTPGRDVVFVNSDVIVGAEWLERLTAAALSSDTVATATSLTNHGTIVSAPYRNHPVRALPDHMTPAEAARRVAVGSRQLRPTIPTAIGHCFYVRRHVVDLVGPFDESFDPGYGEEVDFSQRAVAHGFRHVVADDVFTYHRGGSSFGDRPEVVERRQRHEEIVRQRYPWYGPWVTRTEQDRASGLADALGAARRSLLGLTVGVDGLCLGPHLMGTQHNVVSSIRALAGRREINRLVAFVPVHMPTYLQALRDELRAVEFVGLNLADGIPESVVDVLYRPYQVSQPVELDFLHRAADRFVVNQLDTIAFEDPAYFGDDEHWLAYRNLTRLTLELAHGVAFISERSRQSALAEGLLADRTPTAVVSCGADAGSFPSLAEDSTPPAPLSFADDGFLLCIGASYLHKNRRFALEVWTELRRRGWQGRLVLAGPTPPYGNSFAREAEWLLANPDLRADVVALGAITEAEKHWLYGHAALVLYPSTVEGFGLVPFEAAQHGVPTLATRLGSLDEVLPVDIPVLDGFDVLDAADRAWKLLFDSSTAADLTTALQERSRSFTWAATAQRLVDLFDEALAQPRGRILVVEGEGDTPIGLSRRSRSAPTLTRSAAAIEHFVQAVVIRPALKQALSPNGSRRQRTARDMLNRARRRFR